MNNKVPTQSKKITLHFEKANLAHEEIIFKWLAEPHMQEFWDNSEEHKEDIKNFLHKRKQHYFSGTTQYWIGAFENQPFCFLLSDELRPDQNLTALMKKYLSKSGKTISLDFGIGNKNYLGKGLAAPTLAAFVDFFHTSIEPTADTFFIDPDENNPRAKHVYEKAGFQLVGDYEPTQGAFIGQKTYLMMKKLTF